MAVSQHTVRSGKTRVVVFGEGCLSGAIAAAVTMAGLSLALDDMASTRHLRNNAVIFFGLVVVPFLGAALARAVLPASGGVNIAWLGTACFGGLVIGLLTLPWPLWSPEPSAYQNTIWVTAVVTVSGCAAAVWSRWRASRGTGRWSVRALAQLEQKLDSAPGRIFVASVRRGWIALNTAVFFVAAWYYWTARDDTNWMGLIVLTFFVLLFPAGILGLFALPIVTEIFPSTIDGQSLAVTVCGLWAATGAISYRFWFVWIPRAIRRKLAETRHEK